MIELARSPDWDRLSLFLASWGTFIIAACCSIVVQIFYNRKSFGIATVVDAVFPWDGWSRRSAFIDVVMYLLHRAMRGFYRAAEPFLAVWTAASVATALQTATGQTRVLPFDYFTIICCAILVFLVADFTGYASHYLRHKVPILWELHKVHHSATFLNPATASRIHPLERLTDRLSIVIAEGLSIGFLRFVFGFSDVETLALLANVRTIGLCAVFEELKHSHFTVDFRVFDKLIFSPRMHQVHHSEENRHFGKNYGDKLSIWDLWFGTAYFPERSETWGYGLGSAEGRDYETIGGVYVGPVVKIWRRHIAPLRARLTGSPAE